MAQTIAAPDNPDDDKLIQQYTNGDFAKMYQLKESQCLVTWNETDEGGYYVSMEFRVCGVRTEAKFDFEELEHCLAFWNGITQEGAQRSYDNVKEQFLKVRN